MEFLISIRCGLLPLRLISTSTGRIIVEVYLPHRCAHQFGYDQTFPAPITFPTDLSADGATLARCWSSILARETGTTFLTIRSFREPRFGSEYRKWFNSAISTIAVKPSSYDNMMAEGKTKAIKKKVQGRSLKLPDFVGVDSELPVGPYLVKQVFLPGIYCFPYLFHLLSYVFLFHALIMRINQHSFSPEGTTP